MKRTIGLLSAVLLISGCVGKPVEEMSYTERNALAGTLVKRCMDQGLKLGSAEMKQCTDQEGLREVTIRRKAEARRESITVCRPVFDSVICS